MREASRKTNVNGKMSDETFVTEVEGTTILLVAGSCRRRRRRRRRVIEILQ
jgi:hypothetical protein